MTQKYEKISALVDGENAVDNMASGGPMSKQDALQADKQRKDLVKSIASDPELHAKWRSYHLTRDLLRNDMSTDMTFDISDRVSEALKDELPIIAPKPTWRELPVVASILPIVKQSSQLAMVACVTALVIFGVQTYNEPEISDPFTTAPPILGPQGGLAPVSLQPNVNNQQDRMNQLLEQRRQLNALIQDHVRQQKLRNLSPDGQNNELMQESISQEQDEQNPQGQEGQ